MSAVNLALFVLLALWVLGLSMRLARTRREIARYMPAPTGPRVPVPERLRLVGTCDGEEWCSKWKSASWGPMVCNVTHADLIRFRLPKRTRVTGVDSGGGLPMMLTSGDEYFPFGGHYHLHPRWELLVGNAITVNDGLR